MPTVHYRDRAIALRGGQSVLEAFLEAGIQAVSSCRSGVCQSCVMRCRTGAVPARSQAGLKDTLRAQGFFMPCVCFPEQDIHIADADAMDSQVLARIVSVEPLSHDVVRVRIEPLAPFDYRAGQFLNLVRCDGLTRAYSIASLPGCDRHIELHVRQIPGGRMSRWLAREARPGQRLGIRGPAGECVYVPGAPDQPLTLIGTGTGLSPLYGVARQALRLGHTGPIRLYHGALHRSGLYLVDPLLELAARHLNLTYTRCLLQGEPSPGVRIGALTDIVGGDLPNMRGHRVYLCGDPGIVRVMRKQVFLCGASLRQVHGDAFVTSAGQQEPLRRAGATVSD